MNLFSSFPRGFVQTIGHVQVHFTKNTHYSAINRPVKPKNIHAKIVENPCRIKHGLYKGTKKDANQKKKLIQRRNAIIAITQPTIETSNAI